MNRELTAAARWWNSSHNRRLVMLGAAGLLGILLIFAGNLLAPRGTISTGPSAVDSQPPPSPSAMSPAGNPAATPDSALAGLEAAMSRRLEEVLGQIAGAGSVQVMITLSSSDEQLFASEINETVRTTVENDGRGGQRSTEETSSQRQLTLQSSGQGGGQQPVVTQVRAAVVRGVLVVAEGADDPLLRWQLSRAVQSVLDVPIHRIQVIPGRSDD